MKLKFKQGSEVQKVITELYEKKENSQEQAIKIIEEVTGCKVKTGSGLGYRWCFDWNYSWLFHNVYFEHGIIDVPGYTHEVDQEGHDHHKVNKRKRTIYNKLLERFQKEVPDTSIKPLNRFGIKNEAGHISYHWLIDKDDNGEIVMFINPAIFDLIDFSKSVENGEQTVFVEQ